MLASEAERMISERISDPLVTAVRVVLEDELEKYKNELLKEGNEVTRGKGLQCMRLLKLVTVKVNVDNRE